LDVEHFELRTEVDDPEPVMLGHDARTAFAKADKIARQRRDPDLLIYRCGANGERFIGCGKVGRK